MRHRTKIDIKLAPDEEQTLRMWSGAGTGEQRMARRANVVLLSAAGSGLAEVSRRSGLSVQNCSKWRSRFMAQRLDGLRDRPRPGAPARIKPECKVRVVALACSKPTDGSSHWTITRLAGKTGLSRATVHRILNEGRLKPHKVHYWCGRSPDPEFEPKQAAILGLYLSPPESALVLSVDEKTQMQALERTQPELPMRPGDPRRQTATYKRHGTVCLLAALAVHSGEVAGRCVEHNNHHEFLKFLKYLYRRYPHKQLHIIVDNLKVHQHQDVTTWAAKRRRLTFHFTPTYASWLNQIEIWFNIFTRDVIRGGAWESRAELATQIIRYIRTYSRERAHPFRWTYTGKPLAA